MSVEREARRALRRVAFYRLLVEVLDWPSELIGLAGQFLLGVSRVLGRATFPILYLESDAARRYRTITGCDLGVGVGSPHRYLGLTTDQLDRSLDALGDGE